MPSQVLSSVENNFTKGLVTEFTGLNFPENAATDADNTEFTIVGDVVRREGIDYETNFQLLSTDRSGQGMATYKWNNAGGRGLKQLLVTQIGGLLRFWETDLITEAAPLSHQQEPSTVTLSSFVASGVTFDPTAECQFADGNGYLFVFHPSCDPFYVTFEFGIVTGNTITVQVRDFTGLPDGLSVTSRPTFLSNEHNYNLINQGWTTGNTWFASSGETKSGNLVGTVTFTVASGLAISGGDTCNIFCADPFAANFGVSSNTVVGSGTVSSYSGTTLTLAVTYGFGGVFSTQSYTGWHIGQTNLGHITTWFSDIGNYPSNADVWWYFKDNTGLFNPTTQVSNVTLGASPAPQGHFVLSAFNQQRGLASGVPGLTDITTTVRPRTGCWFQGRVWYSGLDGQQVPKGDAPFYTWTENIYFSQIVNIASDFGQCYQTNDPTSEQLFDLLPTDGGVITIQGSGSIFKLFPIQNGLLVFAANGIWFITGSQGIGFSANDYTITKISSVQAISGTSFVNVQGLPYFWNEEGIYAVQPAPQGGLTVEPLTVGTILSFYNSIPASSKSFVRGDYHPIDYVIQWVYRGSTETGVTDRYEFDKILNYNTYNKAFFPYTVATGTPSINSVNYVSVPGGIAAPDPTFKYIVTTLSTPTMTFADEHDDNYIDWFSADNVGINYESHFVTGYKLHGQGQRRFQIPYIYIFSRADTPTSYKIQGLWDYATTGNSGRWSVAQLVNNNSPNFGVVFRRHKIRGRGLVLQLKVSSAAGQTFDIMGWSTFETTNTGI